jgi:chromosome partitioning protein
LTRKVTPLPGSALTGATAAASTYQVLIGEAKLGAAIRQSEIPGLDCVPSSMDLLGAELELAEYDRKTFRLRDSIEQMYTEADPNQHTPIFWLTARHR